MVQRRGFGQISDHGFYFQGIFRHFEIIDPDRAGCRGIKPCEHPQSGRLAGPVGAEKAKYPAGFNGEADAVNRTEIAVILGQILNINQYLLLKIFKYFAFFKERIHVLGCSFHMVYQFFKMPAKRVVFA
jgi:hypothetical protein